MILILPTASATSELNYQKILDKPWDHSPITVYIDNKSVPTDYSPTYYTQVIKALDYWEEGGNGKLNYTPAFKIIDSGRTDADISISWVQAPEKSDGAYNEASGNTIPIIADNRFVHVDITLGVGKYQGPIWIRNGDDVMLFIAEHELGHALGLDHSNDKEDIMYPTYLHIGNINPRLLNKYDNLFYVAITVFVFIFVSWLLKGTKKR
jgi:predicted Zn-dependent protease